MESEIVNENVEFQTSNLSWLRVFLIIVNSAAIIFFLIVTNPTTGGPKIVITLLALIFTFVFQLVWGVIRLLSNIFNALNKIKHPLLFSQLIAFSVIFLIGLKSLNQLGIADITLTLILVSLVYFYILRRF